MKAAETLARSRSEQLFRFLFYSSLKERSIWSPFAVDQTAKLAMDRAHYVRSSA
jgi:hypothetical protein